MHHLDARIAAVRAQLAERELDALVVESPVNRRYLSGFTGSAGALVISRERQYLLVDFRYVQQAEAEAPHWERLQMTRFPTALAELLRRADYQRVAFEAHHVPVAAFDVLKETAAHGNAAVSWVPTTNIVESIRGAKDEDELRTMQRAIDLADAAFSHILDELKPGRTEREIAMELEFFMRRSGASGLSFDPIVASGPNGALPHARPSDRVLQTGDLVTMDFGCIVDGYCSDMTRTVAIGAVDDKQKQMYDLVLQAQQTGIDAVQPGRTGREVDTLARQVIIDAGHGDNFGHGLGHGIGMEVHEEFPRLSQASDVELVPGMVTSVEPGVYIPGWGGIRIEDLVVVTADGCRVLSHSDKELIIV